MSDQTFRKLPTRVGTVMRNVGIENDQQLIDLIDQGEAKLRRLRSLGPKSILLLLKWYFQKTGTHPWWYVPYHEEIKVDDAQATFEQLSHATDQLISSLYVYRRIAKAFAEECKKEMK